LSKNAAKKHILASYGVKYVKITGNLRVARVVDTKYSIDVLWVQPIKLAQVASTSELLENQHPSFL
jgi:hypothetical protein